MAGRSSIFSGKNIEQEIGYIEGGQAFDLFERPRATYDRDTGLLRDPNTLAIIGYITLKSTFVGSSRIAEELFAEPGSARPRERRDNDPVHAAAEAPAEIMRRVGPNEQYGASRIGESRSNFERFASAHPVELNHAEIFAEARDRPASQNRSGQQSKYECVLGAVETPPLNDPSLQGDTRPFDAGLQSDIESSKEASPQGYTRASNEASSQGDAESSSETKPSNDMSPQADTESLNGPSLQADSEPSNEASSRGDAQPSNEACSQGDAQSLSEPEPSELEADSEPLNEASSSGDTQPSNEASSQRDARSLSETEPSNDTSSPVDTGPLTEPSFEADSESQGDNELSNEPYSQGDTEPSNDASLQLQADTTLLVASLQSDAEPSSAADTKPSSVFSLQVEPEPPNGPPLQRESESMNQLSLHGPPELNGPSLQDEREAADEPCVQTESEPLRPSFQQEPKLSSEPSLRVERDLLNEPPLEDDRHVVVAPSAPLNDAGQTAVSQSSELTVSEPNKGDLDSCCRILDVSAKGALRAVDNFMVELAEFLHARRSSVETTDPSSNQDETWPRLSLCLRNDSQQQDLRYDPHTDWVGLIDEGETFGVPHEKPPNGTKDTQTVSQNRPLPAMVPEPGAGRR